LRPAQSRNSGRFTGKVTSPAWVTWRSYRWITTSRPWLTISRRRP